MSYDMRDVKMCKLPKNKRMMVVDALKEFYSKYYCLDDEEFRLTIKETMEDRVSSLKEEFPELYKQILFS